MASSGESFARGTVSFVASESIAVNLLVEVHTVADQVSLCPANGCPLGVNASGATIASSARGDFQILTPGDRFIGVSSAAIAIGDYVMPAASGQIAPESGVTTKTAFTIGVAESATSGSAENFFVRVTV